VLFRLLKLGSTFAVAVMAASAQAAVGDQAAYFVLGYLGTRVVLLVLYARAWRHVPEARSTTTTYLACLAASSALWAVSLAVPDPARYWLWAAGIAVETAGALATSRLGRDVPVHVEHLPERFGLFVILVLGESVAAVVIGMRDTHWALSSVTVAAIGFALTAALWWAYFDVGGAAAKHQLLQHGADQFRQDAFSPLSIDGRRTRTRLVLAGPPARPSAPARRRPRSGSRSKTAGTAAGVGDSRSQAASAT
jgi:low temperature requirement protein LtrA